MLNNTQSKKPLWMTLIELLIVITILGILIAILAPKIGGTQEKTRDITRQTQVQELSAALMSYKQDFWEFPIISSPIISGGNETLTWTNRWDISQLNDTLKAWWYISKIQKDPSDINLADNRTFENGNTWYYLYRSDGQNFVIITPIENPKNWNSNINIRNIINNTDILSTEILETGNIYIYKYIHEIL